jgi:hypothetical protein
MTPAPSHDIPDPTPKESPTSAGTTAARQSLPLDDKNISRFNLICRLCALVWLLVLVPVSQLGRAAPVDFGQFYLAGQVARLGLWDSLYPAPAPNGLYNAGWPEASTMRPAYARLAQEHGVGDTFRFIRPPPVALVLIPLGYLDFKTASWVWLMIMAGFAWAVAVQAGQIFEVLAGRPTRWAGAVTLMIGLWPRMIASIRWGNISPLLALLIGITVLGLLRHRDARAAGAIVVGALANYTTVMFLPLVLAMRRWRVLAWMAAWGILGLAVSVPIMGTGPFTVFLRDISPTLSVSPYVIGSQSLHGLLYRLTGQAPLAPGLLMGLRLARWAALGVVLGVIATRPVDRWREPVNVFAASAALVSWLLVFGAIFWHHYSVYLCPFWPWLVWEAMRSPARRPWAVTALALVWVPWATILRTGANSPFDSYILLSTSLILILAIWRLLARPR